MTQEAAENYFNMKNYIVQELVWSPIMGLFTHTIVALFTRRDAKAKLNGEN